VLVKANKQRLTPPRETPPSGDEPILPGGQYWYRVGGKVIIDATKPPLCAGKEARLPFERLKPMGWETVRLEDFLPK
jgi:hypothetical protein